MKNDSNDSSTNRASSGAQRSAGMAPSAGGSGDAVGEGVGGVAGVATGAAIGSLGGPIGTIIGGIAGAATGWWAGREISHAASDFDAGEDTYRTHFANRAAGSDPVRGYEQARPAYQLGHVAGMNPEYAGRPFADVETDLRRGWESQPATQRADWSAVRGFARDAYGAGSERRLTLSEEQLAVGKRQVQAGEVSLRKTVETAHVEQQVALTHDEVTIERRPLDAAAATHLEIGEQTIRVPLTREEAVVDKRVVAMEEVIVRTRDVTETETVEADLRKERLVTEGLDPKTGR